MKILSPILAFNSADQLAKKGAEGSLIGPEPAVGISKETCKLEIRKWVDKKHKEAWKGTWALTHSKKFIKEPNKHLTEEILLRP